MKNCIAQPRRLFFLFQYALIVLLLGACAGPDLSTGHDYPGDTERGGFLSLFLNLQEEQSPPVRMELRAIEVLADPGSWQPLTPGTTFIDARTIAGGQIFLARGLLQPGNYSRIRLLLKESSLLHQDGLAALAVEQDAIELALPSSLYLDAGDSHSLFLTWDVSASLQDGPSLNPVLRIAPRLKKMIADAAYVSCPEINTVFMIRTDRNRVYDSMGVSDRPMYLFSSPVAPEENLFALTVSQPGIKRIGPSVNSVIESYRLPMTGEATHMTLDPDGRLAYIVDGERGTVMRMNLESGHVEERVRLGYGPVYILYLEKRNLLAVSLTLSQNVALLDPDTLANIGMISTGSRPAGMMVLNDLLYIAEEGGNSVLVYDLERNRMWKRIPVDFSPRRILAADGYIYVSNYDSRSISLLRPGQLGVTRNIPLPGAPLELAYVSTSRWIYVGNEGNNSISVIDPATSTVAGHIPLGARPGGIAVINR
ncbi:MAG: YncE family protein [Desulfobulbaceae bacterium]|nr:YncE family protein [Desulfobulbaceae bacterium]